MKYYNTNKPTEKTSLKQAVMQSANDANGLYMPEYFPQIKKSFLNEMPQLSFQEISFHIAKEMFGEDVPENMLRKIVDDALSFQIPLVKIHDNISVLELFHGPTMAFKDVGARFMAGLVCYFNEQNKSDVNILVATSGDTGGAVASAFLNKPGIKVTILYPSKRVSFLQEQQLTTMGDNISAIEIDGSFDDCQSLVKMAFADGVLSSKLNLISANSINFARLFPQSFYYFHAYAQVKNHDKPIVFSVPSGNFGNLTAGLIAKKMGLPIHKFIAATNANDVIPQYLKTNEFTPKASIETISNAMDVGNPSNFFRITSLFDNSFQEIIKNITGFSITDDETRKTIKSIKEKYNYVLDPHGAVAYTALHKYMKANDCEGVLLETAHPSKFLKTVEEALMCKLEIPTQLKALLNKEKQSTKMNCDYEKLKNYLLSHYN